MIKRMQEIAQYELPIKLEKQTDGSFVAFSPTWKDIYAQGDSLEEAILEVTAVAQTMIELYQEENLSIPLKKQKGTKRIPSLLNVPVIVTS